METIPTNIKPREVRCPQCKKTIITDAPAPVCEDCFGKPMITVIRFWTNDELGPTDSRPT